MPLPVRLIIVFPFDTVPLRICLGPSVPPFQPGLQFSMCSGESQKKPLVTTMIQEYKDLFIHSRGFAVRK
jgi:hypothetical protein